MFAQIDQGHSILALYRFVRSNYLTSQLVQVGVPPSNFRVNCAKPVIIYV